VGICHTGLTEALSTAAGVDQLVGQGLALEAPQVVRCTLKLTRIALGLT